ncbi:hypothetical protein [Clostridium sp. UBA5988]|uniref:hypothetical protein n=1 Tax=Clostridium sp. UBA5988 TaxID=1946369 RepID=UPI003217DECE
MDISLIRKYLIEDTEINSLVGSNIFLLEKPNEINADDFICLLYKPLNGGVVKSYQIEVRLFSKDIMKLMKLEKSVIDRLDWTRQQNISNSNSIIYDCELLNGGGTIKDSETGVIETLLFFMLKTK